MIELQAIHRKGINEMARKAKGLDKEGKPQSAIEELWQLLYRGQMMTTLNKDQMLAMRSIANESASNTELDAIQNLSNRFGIAWHQAIALMDDSDRRIEGERLGRSLLRNGNAINRMAHRTMNYPIGYSRSDEDSPRVTVRGMSDWDMLPRYSVYR